VSGSEEQARLEAAYAKRTPDDPRYTLSDPAFRLAYEEREREVLRIFRTELQAPLSAQRILDVGCGNGAWLGDLVRWGADPAKVVGVDPLPARVERARQNAPSGVRVELANGTALPFADAAFDLAILSTVVSSIADGEVAMAVAREARRVLRPGGLILWYDFFVGNPRNRDVRGVTRGEIEHLFPGALIRLHRITLAPPLARIVAPRSLALAKLLGAIPLLRTHYLGSIRS
jgi:SAM-dependent methyltransferase